MKMNVLALNKILGAVYLLCALTLFSCNKESQVNIDKEGLAVPIRVTASDSFTETKTAHDGLLVAWVAGDKIGIYSPNARPTSGGSAGVVNSEFTAASSSVSSAFTGNMYWGTGSHNFYSYYPYTAGSGASNVVPISLSAEQVQSAGDNTSHLATLDFLIANPLTGLTPGDEGTSGTVNFRFNHAFTLLEFQIINGGTIDEIELTAPGLLAITSNGVIDITQTTPASTSDIYVINSKGEEQENAILYSSTLKTTISTPVVTTSDYNTTPKIFMMILPKGYDGEIDIVIKSDGVYKHFPPKATPAGGFKRSTRYKVQLNAQNAVAPVNVSYTPPNAPESLTAVTIGTTTWSPVNVGYTEENKYGTYHQFSRKFGITLVGGAFANKVAGPVTMATGNLEANKNTFYTGTFHWASDFVPANGSWNMTLYNPCPEGWRVPTAEELISLANNTTFSWVTQDGINGARLIDNTNPANILFFPAGGHTDGNGNFKSGENVGQYGDYWSSTVSGQGNQQAACLEFNSGGIVKVGRGSAHDSQVFAHLIRCVKQ